MVIGLALLQQNDTVVTVYTAQPEEMVLVPWPVSSPTGLVGYDVNCAQGQQHTHCTDKVFIEDLGFRVMLRTMNQAQMKHGKIRLARIKSVGYLLERSLAYFFDHG